MFKRRTKVSPTFNMASMTDIIFLLLIFFMITSTMVSPNAIKVLLPQGKKQTTVKATANLYAAAGNDQEEPVTLEELPEVLNAQVNDSTELFVSLYADEAVPYRNIVEILSIANENHFKMVLATRPPSNNE